MKPWRAGAMTGLGVLCAVAACSRGGKDSGDRAAPAEHGGAAEASQAAASGDDAWALKYTGGKAGRASGAPFVIGWVNQEGATPSFPEGTFGLDAAVKYVNERLGGVGGRPIRVEKCFVQSEEDGQRCGTQLLNADDLPVLLTGTLVVGNKSLYTVIANKKPIVIGNPVTMDDFFVGAERPNAYALSPGSPGLIQGLGLFSLKYLPAAPKTAAIVANDNPAAKAAAEKLLKPVLEKGGVKTTTVYVANTAQTPEFAQAIQAAGVTSADVFFPLTTLAGCIATYDALTSLSLKPTVVASAICAGLGMAKHLKALGVGGDAPDGWYLGGYGYNSHMPDEESGMNTYRRVINASNPEAEYTGFASVGFANLLTVVKLINKVGVEKATSEALTQAIREFTGPMMYIAGPIRCGWSQAWPSLCSSHMGVEQYKDGKWLSIADGMNGKSIDVANAM